MFNLRENSGQDEIVISGISGQFPYSLNIKEFEYNLYNKINMVNDSEDRWKHTNPNCPKYSGKIPDLGGFDATFFGVHKLQADNMDPQTRVLLEESFKSVMDAGINPYTLRGENTGVFIGSCVSESENYLYYNQNIPSGFGITGCSMAMFANRISYLLGLTGPSLLCDTACSSSMYALNLAYRAFRNGDIDSAIVGGANLCLHPNCTTQFRRLGVLSPDGFCCPFDVDANGYTRSETIGCIFLQRRSKAKRIYATLLHCDTNCDGYKPEGITYPSGEIQEKLLRKVYHDLKFDVDNLGYLEAHSTGTIAGDPEECRAVDNAICRNRKDPLLVGSVKSNCGHAEPASGICSIAKAIFTMQNNLIPPNINFNKPKPQIEALNSGRLRVVVEPTSLPKPYIGVNSFGFGGANAHAVLRQYEKTKILQEPSKSFYCTSRIVTWSGRTEQNVNLFLDDLETKPLDPEYLALVQSAHAGGIQGMVFRGFAVLDSNSNGKYPKAVSKKVQHFTGVKRPLVWVFSGMGSQWVGMGKSLMEIPLFNQSIQLSHNTLKAFNIDLIHILTADEPNVYENILHSFVGIAAIQIALVDILRVINITPDFIIGHSVGELGCAYADNCMTAEQMILAAYYRGKVSVECEKIRGSMAAIGLSYKDIQPMIPKSIEVACHNSSDSCTISGPHEDVASFVKQLKLRNIFAKEVQCSNIAYHSKYIAQFGPMLLKYLKNLMPEPKLRSNKWISTSVPTSQWATPESKYSSAEYHTNNLLNSVLFEEASMFIPKNALTIEIAPHALLQSILKNSIPKGIHVGLTRRNTQDSKLHLLNSIGNLYLNGLELEVEKLYPQVDWPVSRGTPSLSHLVQFDRSETYFLYKYIDNLSERGIETFQIKINETHEYLKGHEIDGRTLTPATFYLECVWKTFASLSGITNFEKQSVEFENVNFLRATPLPKNTLIDLIVTVQKGSGNFEVTESDSLVVTGKIREIPKKINFVPNKSYDRNDDAAILEKKDFYMELKLRGYHYNNAFRGVEMAKENGTHGKIKWERDTGDWVTFMDSMLQLMIIGKDSRDLMLPTRLRYLRIHPEYHLELLKEKNLADVHIYPVHKRVISGGIEFVDITTRSLARRKPPGETILERYQFVPYFPATQMHIRDISRCYIQTVLENQNKTKFQIVDFTTDVCSMQFLKCLIQAVGELPTITCNCIAYHESRNVDEANESSINHIYPDNDSFNSTLGNLVITTANLFNQSTKHLDSNGFLILRAENCQAIGSHFEMDGFVSISTFSAENEIFMLMKKAKTSEFSPNTEYMHISSYDTTFQWINKLKQLHQSANDIVLISENEPLNGLLGFINALRKEPYWGNLRCLYIDDVLAPPFGKNVSFYEKQLSLGLAVNVYRQGNWGCYRHLLLASDYPAKAHTGHVYSAIQQTGNLSSIKWIEGPGIAEPYINVVYSSLNFKDVMFATGRLPSEILEVSRADQTKIMGFEFSGIDLATKKPVMGMTAMAAFSSHVSNKSYFVFDVPKHWTLREAATVPVVYITVYYAFFFVVDIRKGKSILIHAGSGGIGIAAIRVALAYGLEIFTTVSTPEKKAFLLNMFPSLKENHIGNSRDTSFEDMVMEHTNGNGVDFVLNCLSEDKLIASTRCLGSGGHFLEIGKFDITNNSSLGLGAFINELNFHAIIADNLLKGECEAVKGIREHLCADIKKGIVQPLPSTVFSASEVEKAFRFLASGKHIGKILVQIREDANSVATLPIPVIPKIYFDPSSVYVILGGLGGFGLELADWMILRGATKILLSSSRGISNTYQQLRISLWKSYGCDIEVNTCDISTATECSNLLRSAMKMGDVKGIFNLAVVLKDGIFSNQTPDWFKQSFKPKADATKILDELSRQLCPNLEHFVVFSSLSCGRGNAGQTNYAMANSIMERIIEDRVSHGLPGKAIQWGAIGEVGLVAQMAAGKIDYEICGTLQQRISSCLETLDTLLSRSDAIVSSMVVPEKVNSMTGQSATDFVLHTIGVRNIKSIPLNSTLSEIGMDSLMGVEIKQSLERDYDILLNQTELRNLTLNKLIEISECSSEVDTKKTTSEVNYSEILKMFYGNFESNDSALSTFVQVNEGVQGSPLIIIPGIDGCSSEVWRNLGKKLSLPTMVLQFLLKNTFKSMDDIVQYTFEKIKELLLEENTKYFQIVAYSFGTMVAHPAIALLEEAGFSGRAIFIDGSTSWMEHLMSSMRSVYSQDELEKISLAYILHAVIPNMPLSTIEQDLKNSYNREDWLQYVRTAMHNHEYQDNVVQYVLDFLDTIIQKLRILHNPLSFKSIGITECPLKLIKPSQFSIQNFDDTYDLSPYVRNTIQVDTLDGNHQTILKNPLLPDLINTFFRD